MATHKKSQIILELILVIIMTTLIGNYLMELVAFKYIIGIIWSIPLVLIIKKYNFHYGLLVILVSTLILLFQGLTTEYMIFLFQYVPLAIIMGYFLYYKFPAGKSLLIILAVGILLNGTLILVSIDKTKVQIHNLQDQMQINVQDTMADFKNKGILNSYEKLGINQIEVEKALIYSNGLIRRLVFLVPGIITINYLASVVFIYFMARKVIKDANPLMPKFSTWHVPWPFIWLIIIGAGLVIVGNSYNIKMLLYLGANLVLVITPFFITIGFSVILYFLQKWKLTSLSKILLILLIIISPQLIILLILLLGIFDPYFDFRGIESNKESVSGGINR